MKIDLLLEVYDYSLQKRDQFTKERIQTGRTNDGEGRKLVFINANHSSLDLFILTVRFLPPITPRRDFPFCIANLGPECFRSNLYFLCSNFGVHLFIGHFAT